MVYYEFYGLPGCGKTTLSRKVVYQLQEKGYKVADFSCIFLNDNFGKPKLIEYVRLIFQIREYSLFYHYWKLFRECHCNSKRRLTNLMILTNKIFRESRKNRYDMVLLEEGIIQFISSFTYLGAIRKSNRFDKIVKQLEKNVEICPIYCRLDVDTSLGRILSRERSGDRFSRTANIEIMSQALNYKMNNLEMIAAFFPNHFTIDMKELIETNSKMLLNELLKNKKYGRK